MAVVRVPKTPQKAFNPDRRPSALLLRQIEHLEWAVLPASKRRNLRHPKVKTEAQAAERIAQLTGLLMKAKTAAAATAGAVPPGGPAPPPPAALALPPLPRAPKRRSKSKTSTAGKRKSRRRTRRRTGTARRRARR